MQLVEHMMVVAKNYIKENLKEDADKEVQLLFHKPIFTMIKHLHMHVLVGPLNFSGKIHFFGCLTS